MRATARELINIRDTVVEVDQLVVPPSGDNWSRVPGYTFTDKNVLVLSAYPYTPSTVNLTIFTEMAPKYVIVPNNFMLEVQESNEKLKVLVDKYKEYQLANLHKHLCSTVTSGADPEIFVESGSGELIPAFKFLGPKHNPITTINSRGDRNNIYWDGFQAEFDVTPGTCSAWVIDSIQNGLKNVLKAARALDPKAKLSVKTVFDIPDHMLREAAPEHVAFGCTPSLNVYGMKGFEAPGIEVPYRAAGGHVHFGVFWNKEQIQKAIKSLDAILGVAGVSLFAKYDDPRRRQMYGLAGEYRTPSHGFEYRVLSNAWLFHPLMANIVYDLGRPAAIFGMMNFMGHWKATEAETIQAINECNVDLARDILTRNKSLLLNILQTKLGTQYNEFVYKVIMNGMESVVKDPTDIEGNWDLTKMWATHCEGPGKNIAKACKFIGMV